MLIVLVPAAEQVAAPDVIVGAEGPAVTVSTTSSVAIHPPVVVTVKRKVAGEVVTVTVGVKVEPPAIVAAPPTTLHTVEDTLEPGAGNACPMRLKAVPHWD